MGLFWALLGHFRGSGHHPGFGPILGSFGPFSGLWAWILTDLDLLLGPSGPIFGVLGMDLGLFGPILGSFGPFAMFCA